MKLLMFFVLVVLGSVFANGKALALDVTDSISVTPPPLTSWPTVVGCNPGIGINAGIGITKNSNGSSTFVTMSVAKSDGSHTVNFATIEFDINGDLVKAEGFAQSDPHPFLGFITVRSLCSNLRNITTISANTITDPVEYGNASFVGNVFEADDLDDGNRYRYFVGFEGLTGTQQVFRREAVLPPDTTSPSVTLSSTTTTLSGAAPFTVTATFNEDVTGFNDLANDVTVTNATVTSITAMSATVYNLIVTPTGAGNVSIIVPAHAAQDLAGNNNSVSNTLVIGNTIVADTQKAIVRFMLSRANKLASNQPGLTRFLQGDGCGAYSANANEAAGSVNGCILQGNTWGSISSAWSGDDSYTLGTLGVHGFVNSNMLIGGMAQFDRAEDSASNAAGTGYMVGPYFVAKAAEQPLYFEGRLLYGQSENTIAPLGTYTDKFRTKRLLAQLRATGEYKLKSATMMPLLDFTYTDDAQQAYTDSLGNTISGQKVSLMQITAGMDFNKPIPVKTGRLELTGGLSGIYSSTEGGAVAPEFEHWRGRVHLGLNYVMKNGSNLSATGFYDGIATDYESYGVNVRFDLRF